MSNEELPEMSMNGASPPPPATGDADEPPPRISGYVAIERLGRGGMGTVWRAHQDSTGQQVALKVLGEHAIDSPQAREWFDREVAIISRLAHPNIARILQSGLHGGVEGGVYFYAMELIVGLPLDEFVRRRGLTWRHSMELMASIARVVHWAHEHGVVHRDLKPSNILVDADGRPYLLDFGLARAAWADDPTGKPESESRTLGTPAFMSPEQAAGRLARVDRRSDVYSLGAILFLVLAGQTPHDMRGTRQEVLARIATQDVRKPRGLAPTIENDVEAILLKATAHDPEQRYATAGELADDLSAYFQGRPLRAMSHALGGELDVRRLLDCLVALRNGDFSKRMPTGYSHHAGDIARVLNGLMEMLAALTAEQARICEEVGSKGWLGGQMEVEQTTPGAWGNLLRTTNRMAANLTGDLRAIAHLVRALREGRERPFMGTDISVGGEVAALRAELEALIAQTKTHPTESKPPTSP